MKILSLCCLLTAFSSCSSTMPREVSTLHDQNTLRGAFNVPVKQDQSGEDKVTRSVRQLQIDNEVERAQAKKGLRSLARKSDESRNEVVQELVKLVEGSDPAFRLTSPAHYDSWRFAAELLGELRATEALDVLIACIDCTNGISGLSSYRRPAFRALIMIGPEAVPKLTEALSNSRPKIRSYAALALGEIGGTDATNALEHALLSERDKDVILSIQIALRKH